MSRVDALRKQLDGPRDGALLRFSLGSALLEDGKSAEAIVQLHRAVTFDADYSAAWKLLARAQAGSGDTAAAIESYEHGIAAAQRRGDKQAEKEMTVFLRRLAR
jgi:predicted Zn-dependent protease